MKGKAKLYTFIAILALGIVSLGLFLGAINEPQVEPREQLIIEPTAHPAILTPFPTEPGIVATIQPNPLNLFQNPSR